MDRKGLYTIRKDRIVPLYYQISKTLEQIIKDGKIKSGEKLPSEECLAKNFEVSRATIAKAISLLMRKALLSRARGKGTFVKKKEVEFVLVQKLLSFSEQLENLNSPFETEVIALKNKKMDKKIANRLGRKEGDTAIYLSRVRYVDQEPTVFSESYLPYDLFRGLQNEDFTKKALYRLLANKFGLPVVKAERHIRAIGAGDEEANYLAIAIGEPILQIEGISFSKKNLIIEYFDTKLPGNKVALLWV